MGNLFDFSGTKLGMFYLYALAWGGVLEYVASGSWPSSILVPHGTYKSVRVYRVAISSWTSIIKGFTYSHSGIGVGGVVLAGAFDNRFFKSNYELLFIVQKKTKEVLNPM